LDRSDDLGDPGGIIALITRNRKLRLRDGDVPVRVRRAERKRWSRGHGVWVHDVFAFRATPAAWNESLFWVEGIFRRAPTSRERQKLHRLGDDFVVATLHLTDGVAVDVATRGDHGRALLGPVERDVAASRDSVEA
jgi:hypothetical protein